MADTAKKIADLQAKNLELQKEIVSIEKARLTASNTKRELDKILRGRGPVTGHETLKVGFSGTREGMTANQRKQVIEFLTEHRKIGWKIEAHHGDCIGADAEFHVICRTLSSDIKIVVHPPSDSSRQAHCQGDETHPVKPYLVRNRDIVNDTDILIGCPKSPVRAGSGTWYTIEYADSCGNEIQLFE